MVKLARLSLLGAVRVRVGRAGSRVGTLAVGGTKILNRVEIWTKKNEACTDTT